MLTVLDLNLKNAETEYHSAVSSSLAHKTHT